MPMVMSMKVSGKMIKPMALAFSSTLIMQFMMAVGSMICSMDMELKAGTMVVLSTLEHSSRERKTVKVDLSGRMAASMKGTSSMVRSRASEDTILLISINGMKGSSE